MSTHIEQAANAAKSQAPTRGTRVKATRAMLIREARIRRAMRSSDEEIANLACDERDAFIQDMIQTYQAML